MWSKLKGDKWRRELKTQLKRGKTDAVLRAVERFRKNLETLDKAYELSLKIADELREDADIWNSLGTIYIQSDKHTVAHDVSRALRIRLEKGAGATGANYTGTVDGIQIYVYGVRNIPKCKVVREEKVVTEKRTVYRLECGEHE